MSNLLKETIDELRSHNKTLDDVIWIGSEKYEIEKDEFIKLADIEYHSGYGAQKVADDLLIVGNDFWLSREEYDGSEWWKFNTMPKRPSQKRAEINSLICGRPYNEFIGWETLETLAKYKSYKEMEKEALC